LEESKAAIDKEYAIAQENVKSLEGDKAELNEEVAAKLAEIEKIKMENDSLMKSGLNKDELNRRLRANLKMIKKLNQELENKVDELLLENKKLESENSDLKTNVDSLSTVTDSLNQKVAIASTLSAQYVEVKAYKKKNSGKLRKTKLAKRANVIELSCKILANPITENGDKTVKLKIVSPDGKTLGNFTNEGSTSEHSSNGAVTFADYKTFTYAGEEQELVLNYTTEERNLPKGNYLLEVYIDGQISTSSTFTLK
jgi:predicted nuclease with TOPRIM domain